MVLSFVLVFPQTALAGHYGQLNSGHPNDKALVMWYGPTLTQTWINVTNWNRTNNIDPTTFNTGWMPVHDGSDAAVGNGVLAGAYGATSCGGWSAIDGGQCDHKHVTFDHTDPITLDEQRMTGCHEFGHVLALGHINIGPTTSCMYPYLDGGRRWFNSHDIYEIDRYDPPGWLGTNHAF